MNKDRDSPSSEIEKNLVIAHRGTTFYAPEETEAAMRWARNIGAHYLEFDLQRSKDGYLIALHDDNLTRTTDVSIKFSGREHDPVSTFTYEELLSLDAGSWFNSSNPDFARNTFIGLDILTLEDVIQIASGKKIKRDSTGKRQLIKDESGKWRSIYENDFADNGNRPGIYIETKVPELFPGIEEDLKKELLRLGWYNDNPDKLIQIPTTDNKISIANSRNRIILQTFSKQSLKNLNEVFKDYTPICFLLWYGSGPDDLTDEGVETYRKLIQYAKDNGASIIGPSISGAPNNYTNLLKPEHAQLIKDLGLLIHAYSFDTYDQMKEFGPLVDGMFTNRSDETIRFYKTKNPLPPQLKNTIELLNQLGY